MLQIVDTQWKDHLYSLDHLKEGIGLRGYGQRDPLVEYKKESFELFQAMKERVDEEIVRYLWWLRPILNEGGAPGAPPMAPRPAPRRPPPLILNDPSAESQRGGALAARRAQAPASRPARSARRTTPNSRRAVGGDDAVAEDGSPRRTEGRTQRPLPVRQR